VSLFSKKTCEGCAARDGEIAFLRSMLTSARTIVREPDVPQPTGQQVVIREVAGEAQVPEAFLRNPTEYSEWMPTIEGPQREPVGEDMRKDALDVNEMRRAALRARREAS
jgi:hypothetical protein